MGAIHRKIKEFKESKGESFRWHGVFGLRRLFVDVVQHDLYRHPVRAVHVVHGLRPYPAVGIQRLGRGMDRLVRFLRPVDRRRVAGFAVIAVDDAQSTDIDAKRCNRDRKPRQISRVTYDVYRFRNRFHVNMFVITEASVVVTDPINAEAAAWLRVEIGKITDKPITHLIYSHSHSDHARGGLEYGEVPNVITHRNAPEDIDLVEPTIRFDDTLTLEVDDKTFELTYLGPGHGLDFDILIGGHGPVGVKRDVRLGLNYLQELRAQVLQGLKSGLSVDELKQTVTMQEYRDWESYQQWRALNVEGMARHLLESGAVE